MNPQKVTVDPMKEGHPVSFSEPQTIPAGWNVSDWVSEPQTNSAGKDANDTRFDLGNNRASE